MGHFPFLVRGRRFIAGGSVSGGGITFRASGRGSCLLGAFGIRAGLRRSGSLGAASGLLCGSGRGLPGVCRRGSGGSCGGCGRGRCGSYRRLLHLLELGNGFQLLHERGQLSDPRLNPALSCGPGRGRHTFRRRRRGLQRRRASDCGRGRGYGGVGLVGDARNGSLNHRRVVVGLDERGLLLGGLRRGNNLAETGFLSGERCLRVLPHHLAGALAPAAHRTVFHLPGATAFRAVADLFLDGGLFHVLHPALAPSAEQVFKTELHLSLLCRRIAEGKPRLSHRGLVKFVKQGTRQLHRVTNGLLWHQLHQLQVVHVPHEQRLLITVRQVVQKGLQLLDSVPDFFIIHARTGSDAQVERRAESRGIRGRVTPVALVAHDAPAPHRPPQARRDLPRLLRQRRRVVGDHRQCPSAPTVHHRKVVRRVHAYHHGVVRFSFRSFPGLPLEGRAIPRGEIDHATVICFESNGIGECH